jgi:hypothetical protein
LSLFCFYIISSIEGARDDASIPLALAVSAPGHTARQLAMGVHKKIA